MNNKKGQRNDYDAEQYFSGGEEDDVDPAGDGFGDEAPADEGEPDYGPGEEFDV